MCTQHYHRRRLPFSGCLTGSVQRWLAVVTLLACSGGCASSDWVKLKPEWLSGKKQQYVIADEKNPIAEIVCMWQPTTGVGLDNRTTRGFNGQILFLTKGSKLPAIVDGNVEIYLFDDQGTREEQVKPLHCFEFPGESWNQLVADTAMGLQYGVFIPYVRKGTHRAQCSLRIKHTSASNVVTYSEMVNVLLDGVDDRKTDDASDQPISNILPVDVGPSNQSVNQSGARTITTQTIRTDGRESPAGASKPTQFPSSPDGTFSGMLESEMASQDNVHTASHRNGNGMSADEREALIQEAMARLAAQQQPGMQTRQQRSGIQTAAATAESDEFAQEVPNNGNGNRNQAGRDVEQHVAPGNNFQRKTSQRHLLRADLHDRDSESPLRTAPGRQSSTEHMLSTDNHLLKNSHLMDQTAPSQRRSDLRPDRAVQTADHDDESQASAEDVTDSMDETESVDIRQNPLSRRRNPLARASAARTVAEPEHESNIPGVRNRLHRNHSANTDTLNEEAVPEASDMRDLPTEQSIEQGDADDRGIEAERRSTGVRSGKRNVGNPAAVVADTGVKTFTISLPDR